MQERENDCIEQYVAMREYMDTLSFNFCGFRIKILADKIKQDYLKLKKTECRSLNS